MFTIIDGAAIVNMLQPDAARKFSDYTNQVFIPYILSQLQHVNRVDIMWDEYLLNSLKAETRNKRGKGVCQHVEPCNAIPGNWQEFLRIDDNKAEMFSYLAICESVLDAGKQVISTHHADVLSSQHRGTSGLAPCTHEEADSRMLLHLEDAVNKGRVHQSVVVRTVDADVQQHNASTSLSNGVPLELGKVTGI